MKIDNSAMSGFLLTILIAIHPLTLRPIMSVNAGFDAAALKLKNAIFNCLQILCNFTSYGHDNRIHSLYYTAQAYADACFDFYLSKIEVKPSSLAAS